MRKVLQEWKTLRRILADNPSSAIDSLPKLGEPISEANADIVCTELNAVQTHRTIAEWWKGRPPAWNVTATYRQRPDSRVGRKCWCKNTADVLYGYTGIIMAIDNRGLAEIVLQKDGRVLKSEHLDSTWTILESEAGDE